MNDACRLCLAVGTAIGLPAMMAPPVPATPVDPEIMKQIGPRVAIPEESRQQLIEMGRELFFEETFDGNGRTCGTCHPASNNFTIDKEFIEGLPDDDPLFVAEFNPDLEELEKPELLREFGLNADAVIELEAALQLEREALAMRPPKRRNDPLQEARAIKEDARGMMVEERPAIAMGEAVEPQ